MTKELLTQAVSNRNVLTFTYDDKARVIEPHAVGINSKGELVLRGYQIGGDSATSPQAWKLFLADKMVDLEVSNVIFISARPGYKAGDRAMVDILAELPEVVAA